MYICTLTSKNENCHLYPDRPTERGFKFAGQEILCIFWTYLHFFYYSYLIMLGVYIYLILVSDFILG